MPPLDGSVPPEYDPSALASEYIKAREEFDPIFYLIGLAIFMLFFCLINRDKNKAAAPQSPEQKSIGDPKKTFFTREQLKEEFSGTGPSGKIYLACFDTVFDVTSSANFQPEGTYASFAGRDVSVACAFHSTDENYLVQAYDRETTEFSID